MKRSYKRRHFLIDNFQYRLLAFNLIYLGAVLLIFAAALFIPLMVQLESSTLPFGEKQDVASQLLSLHARFWPALLGVFVLLAIHVVIVSHRIAGPLYRFRSVLHAVAEGDLRARVTIRKYDYLTKETDVINAMIESLRTRVTSIEEQYGAMRAELTKLKRAINIGSMEGADRNLESLRARMERLKECLDQFKIADEETRGAEDFAQDTVSASTPGESPEPPGRSQRG